MTEKTIRAPQTNTIGQILLTNNISLTSKTTSFAGRKAEDTKVEAKKKMVVKSETVSLYMQNNLIKSIAGLRLILDEVMYKPDRLLWINLSNNHLKEIDEDLGAGFPQLKTLYLHGNYMSDLSQILKLSDLKEL